MTRVWRNTANPRRVIVQDGRVTVCAECPCDGLPTDRPTVLTCTWEQVASKQYRFWGTVHVPYPTASVTVTPTATAYGGFAPDFAASGPVGDTWTFDGTASNSVSNPDSPVNVTAEDAGAVNVSDPFPIAISNIAPEVVITSVTHVAGTTDVLGTVRDDVGVDNGGSIDLAGGENLTVTVVSGTGTFSGIGWLGQTDVVDAAGAWSFSRSGEPAPTSGSTLTVRVTDWYGLTDDYTHTVP